jgi:hypothetical protein
MRLYKANQRVQDPDMDNLSNPHEVKHWMDPKLIPFAWGFYNEQEEKKSVESSLFLAGDIVAVRTNLGGGVRRKYPCNHI